MRLRYGYAQFKVHLHWKKTIAKAKIFFYQKAFQLKANHPLVDRCMGLIVNKFEQVRGSPRG